ncbi:pimeloyl-ACP methyl ester carboxylesterase [Filimonas zeae]|uniref:Alpha/beta hydrolase n=1 Tax=Filimonas zeae TaxID=1737353 RepID=A0A917J1N1_9BACT|nr:alpha/beta hydrolase [Filimonas zeae]MDR6341178.1 pimeloyl-ACP methyl ester carboxylesterase [Filimonas zeae]GGH76912.1 alpha/beta hydrolase [Filimonas zeae]
MSTIQSRTIVLLTGAYVSHHCWDDWKNYFIQKGYTTLAPPWPYKEQSAVVQRAKQPDKKLASLTLAQLLDHYIRIINDLPEKPILIGHSFGGFLTQVLLNKGYGAAGIAIHSVPPKGVLPLEFSFYKSNAAALGLFSSANTTYLRPFKSWQYAFTNGMTLEEQQRTYDALVIPESRRAIRGALGNDGKVDFKKKHNPLLMLSGSEDQCIPASLNYRNYKRYSNPQSVVEYVNKQGRNHFVLGLPTWKEDADFILAWIAKQ